MLCIMLRYMRRRRVMQAYNGQFYYVSSKGRALPAKEEASDENDEVSFMTSSGDLDRQRSRSNGEVIDESAVKRVYPKSPKIPRSHQIRIQESPKLVRRSSKLQIKRLQNKVRSESPIAPKRNTIIPANTKSRACRNTTTTDQDIGNSTVVKISTSQSCSVSPASESPTHSPVPFGRNLKRFRRRKHRPSVKLTSIINTRVKKNRENVKRNPESEYETCDSEDEEQEERKKMFSTFEDIWGVTQDTKQDTEKQEHCGKSNENNNR